jgi:alpha-glucosidase
VHVYDQGHPDVHQVFHDMRALIDEYEPSRMALGEMHVFDVSELASYYGSDLDELNMPTNFGLLKVSWTASGVRQVVHGLEATLPKGAWPNYVLGTHDDQRLATRLGEYGSLQAAVLLLTLRGSPTLYYGDELGMREVVVPPDRQQDPWAETEPALGRDGCRTPMRWSPDATAGFTSNNESWLPLGGDLDVRNVESQLQDPDSHLNLYRRLLSLRRRSTALTTGSYRPVDPVPPDCFVFERSHGPERVLVAVNFSAEKRSVETVGFVGRIAVSTRRASEGNDVGGTFNLWPHEAVVATETPSNLELERAE